MKTCSKCGVVKNGVDFYKNKATKDGLQGYCKVCDTAAVLARYHKNPEPKREYSRKRRAENPEKEREARRIRALNLTDAQRQAKSEYNQTYGAEHRGALNAYAVTWRIENPTYESDRRKTDLNFRMTKVLRSRLNGALIAGGVKKNARTMELIGCPWVWAEVHLESLFRPGMTWENHGPVWHIDHIKPCAAFDLTDPEQQKACFHWTNLQPLFAEENLRKSDIYPYVTPEPQTRLVI